MTVPATNPEPARETFEQARDYLFSECDREDDDSMEPTAPTRVADVGFVGEVTDVEMLPPRPVVHATGEPAPTMSEARASIERVVASALAGGPAAVVDALTAEGRLYWGPMVPDDPDTLRDWVAERHAAKVAASPGTADGDLEVAVRVGADRLDDLLTMLGINPDERPEHGGDSIAETLARAVLTAPGTGRPTPHLDAVKARLAEAEAALAARTEQARAMAGSSERFFGEIQRLNEEAAAGGGEVRQLRDQLAQDIFNDETQMRDSLSEGYRPSEDYLKGYRAAVQRDAEIVRGEW